MVRGSRERIGGERKLITIGRRLSAAQVERRERLLTAARDLATKGGYEAVTISTVCSRAGVTRATVYHYFGSKDHLLAEVIAEWIRDRLDEARLRPPAGRSPLERLQATFRWVLEAIEREPNLFRATVQAFVFPDPGVTQTQRQLSSLVVGYLELVLGSDPEIDHAALGMVVGHVMLSSLLQLSSGRASAEEMMADLTTTARLLLPRKKHARR